MTAAFPGKFFLTPNPAAVGEYLTSKGWLSPNESVYTVVRAGEGNMNCVLRVTTSSRAFILKQARPWVEKYPGVAAPWDRALMEARFYREVERHPEVAAYLPKLLGLDVEERLLILENLPEARDFTFVYSDAARPPEESELDRLVDFLISLHTACRNPELALTFRNMEMRLLNHEHIFALPLRKDNGLDLDTITPGLSLPALRLLNDPEYCRQVDSLGERYLDTSQGPCLLHGDYFPGSWLRSEKRIIVIDPEFCFYGPPEWDLGVMMAHLYFIRHPQASSQASIDRLFSRYEQSAPLNRSLALQFAGAEIMRRILGVAQLPAAFSLERKAQLLSRSRELVGLLH